MGVAVLSGPGHVPVFEERSQREADSFHASAHVRILRLKLVTRHPIAFALAALVLIAALWPLPSLVDAVTGQPPGDADLLRPFFYVALAPLSNTLDALTFLSLGRAWVLIGTWVVALAAWGALRPGSPSRVAFGAEPVGG